MPDQRFLRRYRVRLGGEFQRAYQRRSSVADGWLIVYGCPNGLPYPRLGLSVSRRVGGAVVRNRWKRLLREAFRLSREKLPPGLDLIVIPRPNREPNLALLAESLVRLAARLAKRRVDR